ncbi:uncharacterized protein EI90DRAFT_2273608 [Cantharellus anzutake]|uniref:uncharacterized protein n=1 Tax=Cantharellus anzutake TaxID=1750568 RepID=UPI001908C803|nr:uncharacterized protein EI90DRAFT_2273608 [Cantharellus anzutake]KAF8339714.1 hypothetical protein EI90DRAFT_2273608 [Cantharellus anzutake]
MILRTMKALLLITAPHCYLLTMRQSARRGAMHGLAAHHVIDPAVNIETNRRFLGLDLILCAQGKESVCTSSKQMPKPHSTIDSSLRYFRNLRRENGKWTQRILSVDIVNLHATGRGNRISVTRFHDFSCAVPLGRYIGSSCPPASSPASHYDNCCCISCSFLRTKPMPWARTQP